MRPVKLPQVPDTATARLVCNGGWGQCAVVALRAAVGAGTQGVLGPPFPHSAPELLHRSLTTAC